MFSYILCKYTLRAIINVDFIAFVHNFIDQPSYRLRLKQAKHFCVSPKMLGTFHLFNICNQTKKKGFTGKHIGLARTETRLKQTIGTGVLWWLSL